MDSLPLEYLLFLGTRHSTAGRELCRVSSEPWRLVTPGPFQPVDEPLLSGVISVGR